ncbi:tryptophan-rich sensory protein TspO [Halodurantibacterium flavum]|uniref:TspO/MBR family protein n=1 Tax=Halodurantibacterium flavum TaxID=1382802 RepID=A0ABW4S4D4_9RHOB
MDWTTFGIFLVACGASAATGVLFPPGNWYRQLDKPGFTPPNWAFPVAWSLLYLMMAAAAARIAPLPGAGLALALWAAQIAFNTLWTPVFFGLRRIMAALVVIAILWFLVTGTLLAFWRLDWIAGLMMLPYLVWVSYAAALNAAIWRLNPRPPA